MARLFRPKVISLLSVRGRTTGLWRSVPVALLESDGQHYLVSAYGDTEWSRNLRAAGTGHLSRRSHVQTFTAVEVPTRQVAPLIEEYLRQFGRLPTVARTFRLLPDPRDHPTFRVSFNSIDR
jgi:deazaflavin-dependent oxidoreductase (nitroreductase family)